MGSRTVNDPIHWDRASLQPRCYHLALSSEDSLAFEESTRTSRDNSDELDGLRSHLELIRAELEHGVGFFVLSNLPTPDDVGLAKRLLLRVASAFGWPRVQDAGGGSVRRIRDRGIQFVGSNRGSDTSEAIGFHTDGRDIALLLCLHPAEAGGYSSVVGLRSVYEEMNRAAPDLTDLLFEPWHFDRRVADGPLTMRSPILCCIDGVLSVYYLPHLVRSAPSKSGLPLNAREIAAIDLFDATCARIELRFDFRLNSGDLLFLNNYTTLHSRSAFASMGGAPPREMLRIWLDGHSRRALRAGFKYGPHTVQGVTYG